MSSPSKTAYALDASALLALLLNERGHEKVNAVLDNALVHSVNVAEVIGKLVREGVPPAKAVEMVDALGLDVVEELPGPQAGLCGVLLAETRSHGLGLGDCVCLTVAACTGAAALTADRQWQRLNGRAVGGSRLRVEVIR
ncbi:MAG: PIN domain-containing protein [Bryobacteraceae bacterium]